MLDWLTVSKAIQVGTLGDDLFSLFIIFLKKKIKF